MPTEYYRAAAPRLFLGVRLTDLEAVMGATAYAAAAPLLLPHVVPEPLHVGLRDDGYRDGDATPDVLALDVRAVETTGGMNEIPRATLRMAHGRDAGALTRQGPLGDPTLAVAPVHVLERVLNAHVRARVFLRVRTTAAAGVHDAGDNDVWPEEWVVLFDGYCVAPGRRGTPEDHTLVIHMTHLLAGLTYSSSISGSVAAGTGYPAAFNLTAFGQISSGVGLFPMTPMGAVAAGLAGDTALLTDFWGYRHGPAGPVGVKGFLVNLAKTDTFAAENFTPALDGAVCQTPVAGGKNRLALAALDVVEPLGLGSIGAQRAVTTAVQAGGPVDGAHTRGSLIDAVGASYQAAGYRYGVPLPFKLEGAVLNMESSKAFTGDIVGASVGVLGPASLWELMAVRYPAQYQIAVCPRATGAVVAPTAPVLDGWWQTVHASEIHDWGDDLANPVPVRGVVLVSHRAGIANALTSGVPTTVNPGATLADGGYDSCQPGVIIYRDMPAWLVTANRFPGTPAPATVGGPRTTAALAAVTGAAAVARSPSPGPVSAGSRKTANRLAKALYQQARLQYRTVSVTCRLRTDVGPGSTVRVEVPSDRFVRSALGADRDAYLVGVVTRVVISVDVDAEAATTQLQLGFVRTEGETRAAADNPLYGRTHPYWNAVFYGQPWCDSVAARAQLGNLAKIGN